MQKINTSLLVIFDEGKARFFLQKKGPTYKGYPNAVCPFGGKAKEIEKYGLRRLETPDETLEREMSEELPRIWKFLEPTVKFLTTFLSPQERNDRVMNLTVYSAELSHQDFDYMALLAEEPGSVAEDDFVVLTRSQLEHLFTQPDALLPGTEEIVRACGEAQGVAVVS